MAGRVFLHCAMSSNLHCLYGVYCALTHIVWEVDSSLLYFLPSWNWRHLSESRKFAVIWNETVFNWQDSMRGKALQLIADVRRT